MNSLCDGVCSFADNGNGLCPAFCVTLIWVCLQKPERDDWGSGVEALECALQLERSVNQSLLDMHKLSTEHNDPHVSLWPATDTGVVFLAVPVSYIQCLHRCVTSLRHTTWMSR